MWRERAGRGFSEVGGVGSDNFWFADGDGRAAGVGDDDGQRTALDANLLRAKTQHIGKHGDDGKIELNGDRARVAGGASVRYRQIDSAVAVEVARR